MSDAGMSDFPKPLLLGHRGAGGEAPENTWPSFEAAKSAGMHGFEIDVLLTSDGVPVCVHDLTLERIAPGHGAVQSMHSSALARLDVGSHFHPRFAGERIPRLADLLDSYGGEMILDIELKGYSPISDGIEPVVINMIRERKLEDRVILSSFNPLTIWRIKKLAPEIRRGFNYLSDTIKDLRRLWFAPFLPTFSKHPQPWSVDERYIARQHKKGIWVVPWAVNEEADMERLLRLGCDGLISDFPQALKKIAENHGSGAEKQAAPKV